MQWLSLCMGSAALLITTAQTAQSDVMNYQCFERDTRRPVAASLIDLSTPEVSCERITLTEPTITSPDQAPEDGAEQPFTDPEISSGPSPYAEMSPDPEVVNRYVRNDPFAARRAMNLARGAATRRNDGLRIYRPGNFHMDYGIPNFPPQLLEWQDRRVMKGADCVLTLIF